MDQVNFKRPIPLGQIALVEAYVYEAGSTSVKVRLRVAREDPRTGDRESTTESHSVYVAVDEDRNAVAVPDLTVESDEGRELRAEAVAENGSLE